MFDEKMNVKNVKFGVNLEYFLKNAPPSPYQAWNLPAFQEYCRQAMEDNGFDLERRIHCHYDKRTGQIVFWQNVLELELSDAIWN